MKKSYLALFAATFLAMVPCTSLFAEEPVIEEKAVEEETNSSKIKKGAKEFFQGLKGTVTDGANTAKDKVNAATKPKYVGQWYFVNGKYATMIILSEDGTGKITQSKLIGENEWTGSYSRPEKDQILFHIEKHNGKKADMDWVIDYNVDKNDYIIIQTDDIPDDPNGFDFSNLTLFTYVGE